MSTQPKALSIADWLDACSDLNSSGEDELLVDAAAELRRLHALNAQMLDALLHCKDWFDGAGYLRVPVQMHCESAIKAAKEQS